MFRGRSASQASLPPMKDQVVKGRPMTIDDDAQRKDGQEKHEQGSGKRRTFLGMHIGGHKDKDKDKDKDKEGVAGRRQSFSSQMGASQVSPPTNGRPSMQSQRTQSGSQSALNLNGLKQQQYQQQHHQYPNNGQENPHGGRLAPSPNLRSSPKISHDGSSIHSDSFNGSSNTHLPPRDARSSPVVAPQTHSKEPGMASPQTRNTSTQQLPIRRPSTINPALERVFTPLMELIQLHSKKMYGASPPEVEMIFARTPQGGQPKQGTPGSPRNDWDEVWMQLSGTSLSVWSMKETKEADKRGERVPPTYYNVTDSSLELLAPLPPPPHRAESHSHPFVFSLNTAGSNRILLSCRSENNLALWVTSLRLAAYEKSRIEEIYTGHLLQTFVRSSNRGGPTLPANSGERASWNEPDSPLVRGRMEGWVRVRIMGGTEWKRLWLVLAAPATAQVGKETAEKRRKSIFGFGGGSSNENSNASLAGVASTNEFGGPAVKEAGTALFYASQPVKGTGKGKSQPPEQPVLTVSKVSQAFAVFPEHLEVITSSNLLKVVGNISGSLVVVEGRPRLSGWAMIMPEKLNGDLPVSPNGKDDAGIVAELLKWVVGFHDAFSLYGRSKHYNWDRDDPESLFFGYYGHPKMSRFFINPAQALEVDYRQDVIANVRQAYTRITINNLKQGGAGSASPSITPSQSFALTNPHDSPPITGTGGPLARPSSSSSPASFHSSQGDDERRNGNGRDYDTLDNEYYEDAPRVPRMMSSSSSGSLPRRDDGTLTPITERSYVASTRSPSMATLGTLAKKGGSMSSKEKPTSGSGSNRDQYLSRRESFSNRLETAMVAEASDSKERLSDGVSRGEQHARSGSTGSSLRGSQLDEKNASKPTMSVFTGVQSVGSRPVNSAPSSASVYSPGVTSYDTHASSQEDERRDRVPVPLAESLPIDNAVPQQVTIQHQRDRSGGSDIPVVAPKPRKANDQFDEDQVLQDNHYLLDQIQLQEPDAPAASSVSQASIDREENALSVSPTASRAGLGRKPSGARAMPKGRQGSVTSSAPSLSPTMEAGKVTPPPTSDAAEQNLVTPKQRSNRASHLPHSASMNADALAALSFVDAVPSPGKPDVRASPQATARPAATVTSQPAFRSSFAPTQSAIDRKERAQEAEKRKEHVMTRPGKAGGKSGRRAAWSASSEEDSEEDEDEDEDGDKSDASEVLQPPSRPGSGYSSRPGSFAGRTSSPRSMGQRTGTPPSRGVNNDASALGRGAPLARPLPNVDQGGAQRRVSRNLPPIPGTRNSTFEQNRSSSMNFAGHAGSGLHVPQLSGHERSASWTGESPQASESGYTPSHQDLNQLGTARPAIQQSRPSARQSVWTSALDAPHAGKDESINPNGKFVTLDAPAHLTKAFTPHGLLQAGLQDKEDRSAKKQQEIAKETGASLLNVPNKPPEPQMGLLGAITAHEKDRKAAGGLGAALTERERDRRLAEQQQRQIDDMQNMQRQSMYPGGDAFARPMSAYGGAPGGGMMSPGLAYGNPGMYWPAPPMNPYAQQQAMMAAQMAYQNSMYMAMSAAGSQVGTPDLGPPNGGGQLGNGFDARSASPMMPGMPGAGNPYMSMYGGYAPSMPGFGMQGMMSPGGMYSMPGSVMGAPMGAQTPGGQNQAGDGARGGGNERR